MRSVCILAGGVGILEFDWCTSLPSNDSFKKYLRNHFFQPAGDTRARAVVQVLQQELVAELEVQGTIALLRQMEHDLASLADQVMQSQAALRDTDSWLSLASPSDDPLSRVEEECQHLPSFASFSIGQGKNHGKK